MQPVDLPDAFSELSLGDRVMTFECPPDSLVAADIFKLSDDQFTPSDAPYLYGNYQPKDLWVKLRLTNPGEAKRLHIFLDLKRIFRGEVYLSDTAKTFRLGQYDKANGQFGWQFPSFPLSLDQHQEQTVLIRISSPGNYLLFSIRAFSEEGWVKYLIRSNFISALFYGMILVILVMNLFVIIRYRRLEIALYFFYVLLVTAVQWFRDGHGLTFWLDDHPQIYKGLISTLINLAQISNLYFVYIFFQLPRHNLPLTRFMQGLFLAGFTLVVFAWIPGLQDFVLRSNGFAVLLTTLVVMLTGYYSSVSDKRDKAATLFRRSYLYAYLIFFLGILLTVGAVQGILRHSFFDTEVLKISFLLEVFTLSISLFLLLEQQRRKEMFAIKLQMISAEKEKVKLEENIVRSELKVLVAQMKPHFIFNSLNSIQHFVMQEDKKNAHLYISKFSKLMRKNLEFSSHPLIPLSEELEALELYYDLEKRRIKKDIELVREFQLTDSPEQLMVPPFLLQPILENSFWHGFNHPQIEAGKIELCLTQEDGLLKVQVKDNGIGIIAARPERESQPSHQPMSQNITKTRLELFETRYNYQSRFSISDRSQPTSEQVHEAWYQKKLGQQSKTESMNPSGGASQFQESGTLVQFTLPLILKDDQGNNY